MNWITRYKPLTPEVGAERTRRIFALRPRDCTDGISRWLEPVVIREIYRGFGWWEELCAKAVVKEPKLAGPASHVYSYEFRNSKENPVEPKLDYEGAVVYRYDPSTWQHIPIGTYRGGNIIPEIAPKLGEWHEYDSSGTLDCGNENGSFAFDSWRDPVPSGPTEIGTSKSTEILPGEVVSWGAIEGCEATAEPPTIEWEDGLVGYVGFSDAVREGRIAEHADEQYPALRGSRGSSSGEVKRQTTPAGNKKTARQETGSRNSRTKKS